MRSLARDERGFSAVFTALAATVLIGFGGLAVDVGHWQWNQRNMQGAADQAAFAAATAVNGGASTAVATTTAKGVTAAMGFADGASNVTVAVNNPPSYGTYNADTKAWEVIITQPQPMWLTRVIPGMTAPSASGRAVSRLKTIPACLIALATSGADALKTSGSATADFSNCDIVVDSSDSRALDAGGGSNILAKNAYIAGNYTTGGGGSLTVSGTLKTGASVVSDPYSGRTAPSVGACGSNPTSPSGGGSSSTYSPTLPVTIYPGVYCGGISVTVGVTMAPGVYIMYGGSFSVTTGSSVVSGVLCSGSGGFVNAGVNGTGGVTIYVVPNGGSTGTVDIKGCLSIAAPTSGNTAGIALWVDRTEPSNTKVQFEAGSSVYISGAVYAPNAEVDYSAGTGSPSNCTQVVSNTIQFSGGAKFNHTCTGTGVTDPNGSTTQLVQ